MCSIKIWQVHFVSAYGNWTFTQLIIAGFIAGEFSGTLYPKNKDSVLEVDSKTKHRLRDNL
jgi:hypothetical protein